MSRRISLGYNAVSKSARKAVLEVFDSGQFSPGPKVREFEEKFAKLHNAAHAIFVNSGTDALRLSLLALKYQNHWPDGSGVLVPALTFVATVNVIIQAGLKPVFVDISPTDYCMDPDELMKQISFRMVAVMPVHLFGQACNPRIFEIARSHGLKVLEDSCETILNSLQGNVSCHSTYMAHHLTTGVGGFALTNDNLLNWIIRSFANHGRHVNYIPGYKPLPLGLDLLQKRFRFEHIGYSSRGTEFEAALGLSQMAGLAAHVKKRQEVATELANTLYPFWPYFQVSTAVDSTCMMFPLVLKDAARINKYDLCLFLEQNGIETRDMMPITNQPCYKGLVSEKAYPVADWINKNGFYIPCTPAMSSKDISHISNCFGRFFNGKRKEAPRLSGPKRGRETLQCR